jgi:hypothetical protein
MNSEKKNQIIEIFKIKLSYISLEMEKHLSSWTNLITYFNRRFFLRRKKSINKQTDHECI